MSPEPKAVSLGDLPMTARRIFDAAQVILSERGYAELTMAALEQESGANRAVEGLGAARGAREARRCAR